MTSFAMFKVAALPLALIYLTSSAPAATRTVLIDFGPNDVTNGENTSSPDFLGQYWNNLTDFTANGFINSLVTTGNVPTAISLDMLSRFSGYNGVLNGGLLAPRQVLLDNLAVTNATKDYFFLSSGDGFTPSFKLTGLNTNGDYRFRFFGSRNTDAGTTRVTRYVATGGNGSFTNTLQTSGNGGWTNVNGTPYYGNNSLTTTITGVTPNANNEIQLDVSIASGQFAYLNLMEIVELNRAPSAATDIFSRNAGDSITIAVTNLLTNDTDPDGDALVFGGFGSLPAGATTNATSVTLPGTNTLQVFNYFINDGFGSSSTGTVTVTVSAANTPTITVLPAASAISFGQMLADSALTGGAATNAIAGVSVPGVFSFLNPAQSPTAGTNSATVLFTPIDLTNYSSVSTNVSITVNKTTPALTSPSASVIIVGDSLGSSILTGGSAVNLINNASVAGGFAFTTPSIIPQVGVTNVSVTFTPADANNYTAGTASVSVTVLSFGGSNNLVVVFGSSVAKGQGSTPTVFTNASFINGYAGLMANSLAGGWLTVTNASLPGESSSGAKNRFASAVRPLSPRFVLIGYSLGNDGLAGTTDPTSGNIVSNFAANISNVVSQCFSNGFQPVLAGVYGRNDYTPANYAHLKNMHLIMNSWDVPSLNFLGTVDDGAGHWVNGYWADSLHPNNAGHEEMFYSFVPTLFDAINAGKTSRPQMPATTRFARVTQSLGALAPLTFTPTNTIHSFTIAFRVRSTNSGTVAAFKSGSSFGTVEIRDEKLVYVSPAGSEVFASVNATNGSWLEVALAYRYSLQQTALIVNGNQAGTISGQFVPDQFILGGPGAAVGRPAMPVATDFQNWCVYRSAWSTNEAQAQMTGNLQHSSMEICAALDDAFFALGNGVTNRAQSLSLVSVNSTNIQSAAGIFPPSMLGVMVNGDGSRTVTFTGMPGYSYRLQATTNLWPAYWVDLVASIMLGLGGSADYTDTNTVVGTQRFYRVMCP